MEKRFTMTSSKGEAHVLEEILVNGKGLTARPAFE